jgi:hypothetical protein
MVQDYTPNPFTPTFGSVPMLLAGREKIINSILNVHSGDGSFCVIATQKEPSLLCPKKNRPRCPHCVRIKLF